MELCENLGVDGLTPSSFFLKQVLKFTSIPIHALIRPRTGNFVYNSQEVKTIAAQIEKAKSIGAKGIVIGLIGTPVVGFVLFRSSLKGVTNA